ncbi:uncharacterized protein LOC130895778 [Diorhabda carinulata]|uniref:uncharacterized protein LOC130895778 n=1 Tax=Diorhabda carinulata TaxID=1163345 RepID=UPI0025A23396|nr:uncharacterized protein LOC130895778 [Diorhabda carinulata]
MVGPNIQDNLFHILLRFRKHNYVLSADITKMYRQILVTERQRNLQKILWRSTSDEDINTYQLNTVTYGTAPAAFLSIRSLHEVAYRHLNESPDICNIILHDFYVDDLLTGASTVDEVNNIKVRLSELLIEYGFPLRKWKSNMNTFEHDAESEILHIGDEAQNKTLGLLWNPSADCLQFSINISNCSPKITKRQILSSTAQIFDPLELLSPVTITAKIILQELWKLKISWDESVPSDLHTTWSNYYSRLLNINSLKIPRQILLSNCITKQLHGFCDASQAAYGACIYIRCSDSLGNCTSNLLCSKTRVAPLKLITIPRLELCGSLLLAELVEKVTCDFQPNEITYWTDSSICIAWINSSPHILKTFVANRVSQIQNLAKAEL